MRQVACVLLALRCSCLLQRGVLVVFVPGEGRGRDARLDEAKQSAMLDDGVRERVELLAGPAGDGGKFLPVRPGHPAYEGESEEKGSARGGGFCFDIVR